MDDSLGLFEQYELELQQRLKDAQRGVEQLKSLPEGKKQTKIREIQSGLIEVENLLKRLDMESRSVGQGHQMACSAKVRSYRTELKQIRDNFNKMQLQTSSGDTRINMGSDYYTSGAGNRERMLQTTQQLNQTGQTLDQGRQTLLQTEELGVSILQDLQRQRDTITNTRDTLHAADDNISVARRVLGRMSRRITLTKSVMIGVIVLLVLVIFFVLVAKIAKG